MIRLRVRDKNKRKAISASCNCTQRKYSTKKLRNSQNRLIVQCRKSTDKREMNDTWTIFGLTLIGFDKLLEWLWIYCCLASNYITRTEREDKFQEFQRNQNKPINGKIEDKKLFLKLKKIYYFNWSLLMSWHGQRWLIPQSWLSRQMRRKNDDEGWKLK